MDKNVVDMVNRFRAMSDFVRERDCGNGIHSFNFSNRAFYQKFWVDETVKARGLFIDVENMEVVARSFDKFFAPGELNENWFDRAKFPVVAYEKYNGFLGIASCYRGREIIGSKSCLEGPFQELFSRLLEEHFEHRLEEREAFFKMMEEDNVSCVFEVIDNDNDPHIVEYEKPHLVLLEVIENRVDKFVPRYDLISLFAEWFNFEEKKAVHIFNNKEAIDKFRESEEWKNLSGSEGLVLCDMDNNQLKMKSEWYLYWKFVRGIAQAIPKGQEKLNKKLQKARFNIDADLLDFMQEYLAEHPDANVLDIRKNFLEQK